MRPALRDIANKIQRELVAHVAMIALAESNRSLVPPSAGSRTTVSVANFSCGTRPILDDEWLAEPLG